MVIRAVLFDWDGTIVREAAATDGRPDLLAPSLNIAAYASRNLKTKLAAEDFERAFQASLPADEPGPTTRTVSIGEVLATAFTWLGIEAGAGDVDACARIFHEAGTRGQQVYDDAWVLLPTLKARGYRTAVVTNSIFTRDFVARKARELGLSGYFDAFVASVDVGLAKPHPGLFHRALSEIAVDAHEALFVGDTVATDIVGARAAGMRAVLIERSVRAHEAAGYLVIERLSGLNELLGDGPAG